MTPAQRYNETKALLGAYTALGRHDREKKLAFIQEQRERLKGQIMAILEEMDTEETFDLISRVYDHRVALEPYKK